MKIRTFGHFIKDGFRSIVRNRLMSIASVGTVAAALFILGIFMILVLNVNNIANSIANKFEIQAFLKNDITTIQQQSIEQNLRDIKGIKSITFVSKEQALENFKKWLGENKSLANGLELQNPLPASYIIKVNSPEDITYVSDQLQSMGIFEKVNDGREVVNKVIRITNFIKYASLILMIILAVVSISLISNTIKLTVYARKREIGIMKYIGATDWFIRWPFVIEGIFLGFIGAIVSILILWAGYGYISGLIASKIMLIPLVTTQEVISKIDMPFSLIGIAIGGLGSILSIRKFLVK